MQPKITKQELIRYLYVPIFCVMVFSGDVKLAVFGQAFILPEADLVVKESHKMFEYVNNFL